MRGAMDDVEQEVLAATQKLYDAIEDMITTGDLTRMDEAWLHSDDVTARHPMDNWAVGWPAIRATWEVTASFARKDRGGGQVHELKPFVHGDIAYVAVVFQAAPSWGGEKIMCTNVLLKRDGKWKIVHHHADPSPAMQAALEKMISED